VGDGRGCEGERGKVRSKALEGEAQEGQCRSKTHTKERRTKENAGVVVMIGTVDLAPAREACGQGMD